MTDPGSSFRPAGFALLILGLWVGRAECGEVTDSGASPSTVVVEAVDSRGESLSKALGFVWDDTSVVTSCSVLRGAVRVKIHGGTFESLADRVVTCSNMLDLAVVRTQEEMPVQPEQEGADTLATGDTVLYYASPDSGAREVRSRVEGWTDSGMGFDLVRLNPEPAGVRSPLISPEGKVVGWISDHLAVSMRAIYALSGPDEGVTLSEMNTEKKFWNIYRAEPSAGEDESMETAEMRTVNGPPECGFVVAVPAAWPSQVSTQGSNCLWMAVQGRFGITMSVRVVSQHSNDLMAELERVETLMLPGAPRVEMQPFTANRVTGMRGVYEDPSRGHVTTMFEALEGSRLYVLSLTYPWKYAEQIQPLVDEILSSLRIQ